MINGKRVLAIIPARGGSKGIKNKNIQPCGGRPLIAWTIDAALGSKYIDRTVVSTDSLEISRAAIHCGCPTTLSRPPELATDEAPMEGVVLHALAAFPGFDIAVLLQPTSPLRTAGDVDAALELLEGNLWTHVNQKLLKRGLPLFSLDTPCSMIGSVVSVHESHAVPFTGEDPPRRQDRKPTLYLNGAVYAFRVGWFLERKRFVTPESVPYVMPAERAVDIDVPVEMALASLLISSK